MSVRRRIEIMIEANQDTLRPEKVAVLCSDMQGSVWVRNHLHDRTFDDVEAAIAHARRWLTFEQRRLNAQGR